MKKSFMIVFMILLTSVVFVTPVIADSDIGFILDGYELRWNEAEFGGIRVENSRTLIPLRIISNLLGYEVKWEQKTMTAIVAVNQEEYRFPLGKAEIYTPDGEIIPLNVSNQAYCGRTYLPMRAFFEVFGFKVDWLSVEKVEEKGIFRDGYSLNTLERSHYVVVSTDPNLPEPTTSYPESTTSNIETTTQHIDSKTEETANAGEISSNNGLELSAREKEVQAVLFSLKDTYPEGMSWTNENQTYVWENVVPGISYFTGTGCVAFAFRTSNHAFSNDEKAIQYNDVTNLKSKIRVGDIVRVNGDSHSVIVIDRDEVGVVIAEGNYNRSVHWGRRFTYEELESVADYYYTRYR